MARPAKRRQTEVATTRSIASFTRVSKVDILQDTKEITVDSGATSKKRKASSIELSNDQHHRLTRRTVSFAPSSDEEEETVSTKRTCRRQQEPRLSSAKPVSPVTVPVKGKRVARANSSRGATAHKPSESTVIAKSRTSVKKTVQTTLDASLKKAAASKKESDLPSALADLVRLNRAFVKTVLVQFTHNNSNAPIDFTSIEPDISRNWGKRKVTIEDIQRCIAIQSSSEHDDTIECPFIVSDYGRGKVCIELVAGQHGKPVNEERLYKQFEDNLRQFRAERAKDEDMMDLDLPLKNLSLGDLPKAAITNRDTSISANPMLAKGQRTLSAFKDGITARQQEKETKQAAAATNPMLNPDGTKMSLLDRLRFKQLAKESGPLPPSGPELERRAALNRVMDISATISMLTLSNPLPRQSFTMPLLLQKLKDSMRVPISDEEASKCIKLIAGEVAPEWLRVVTFGGRDNVVVQKNLQPVDRVLQERVHKMMGQ